MFASKIDYPRVELKNREFSKVDRFLTCRSLLFTKNKLFTILSSTYLSRLAKLLPPVTSEELENDAPAATCIKTDSTKIQNQNDMIDHFKSVIDNSQRKEIINEDAKKSFSATKIDT
jgi:hypothetical protein